jgi:poly-gamma-glutamate synthesis protein (capsule biosynthesis protein)
VAGEAVICAVGDISVNRDDPGLAFAKVQDIFAAADVRFGNCEAVFSNTKERHLGSVGYILSDPSNFVAVRSAGFDVMSFANNHALDGGYSGFLETLKLLHDTGIATVGGGATLGEARQPAFVELAWVTVGFLGYTCVYPPGFEAGPTIPGCATLKIHNIYREEVGQPGTRPSVLTIADPEQKEAVLQDVRTARERADVLVVSMHWGIHALPAELTHYEREIGHALIDAGADLVLGHHQHILKGVEVYCGKPIFYGLGNFVFDLEESRRQRGNPEHSRLFNEYYGEYATISKLRPDYPTFPFHPEARWTLIVRARLGADGLKEVTAVPCVIRQDGCPDPLLAGSSEFEEHAAYLAGITARVSLNGTFTPRGDELVLDLGVSDVDGG